MDEGMLVSGSDSDDEDPLSSFPVVSRHCRFSNVAFIKEVRRLPVLWDKNHPEYANRMARVEAWETICRLYDKDWDHKPPDRRNEGVMNLARKWKNFRDSFKRELKQRQCGVRKYTKDGRQKKPYIYYKLLTFLMRGDKKESSTNSHGNNETQEALENVPSLSVVESHYAPENNSFEFHEFPVPVDYECVVEELPGLVKTENLQSLGKDETKLPRMKRAASTNFDSNEGNTVSSQEEDEGTSTLQKMNHGHGTEEGVRTLNHIQWNSGDEDKFFLLSLVSDVKQVPDDLRLDMRVEIMNVIKKYKNMKRK